MKPERLTEHVADWNSEVTVDERLVRNVVLSGLESANGYTYAADAMTAAVPKYVGKPVFLDHASDQRRPLDRSTRDVAGTIVSARFEAGRMRGDVRTLETEAGRTFLGLAAESVPGIGMSHVVLAKRSRDGKVVESIEDVVSVDAVAFPATTKTFRESTDPSEEPEMTLAELKAQHPELAKQIAEEAARDADAKVRAELDSEKTRAEYEAAAKKYAEQAAETEMRRQVDIRALCAEAGEQKLAETYCADRSFTVEDVRAKLFEQLVKKNKAPSGDDPAGDPIEEGSSKNPEKKFKKEYAENRVHFVEMGISEKQYVRSRMIDEGLEPLVVGGEADEK